MTSEDFWDLIDEVHAESGGDMDKKCDLLTKRLMRGSAPDLRAFMQHFDAACDALYTWKHWGAAFVIHGGCSDDAFSDFRSTIVSHGRDVYFDAVSDPESLARFEPKDEASLFYEGFEYVMNDCAEEKLGDIPPRTTPFPSEPEGEEWDEDTVGELFPKLAKRFGWEIEDEAL